MPLLLRVRARAERGLERLEHTHAYRIFSGFGIVQEIRGREETGDTLHRAALAINRVLGVGVARAALCAHGQGKMPAGAAAGDAEAVGVHAIAGGIVPNEPHGPVDVRHDLRDDELRLRAVHHSENRVATV